MKLYWEYQQYLRVILIVLMILGEVSLGCIAVDEETLTEL